MADRKELKPSLGSNLLLILIILVFGMWLKFLVWPGIYPSFEYEIDKGTAFLETHDWSESVSLLSPWDFYWNQTISPADFLQNKAPVPDCQLVPAYWSTQTCGQHTLSQRGQATYHIRLKIKPQKQGFALHLLRSFMAYKFYVNGQLIAQQSAEDGANSSSSLDAVNFGAGLSELDLVLQVQNTEFMYGGVYNRIRLGLAQQVTYERFINRAIELGIGSCFLIMALYHFAFFCLRRKSFELLLFALICSTIAWRIAFVGQGIYFDLTNQARNEHLVLWVMYMTYYLAVPLFANFVYALFPTDLSFRITVGVNGLSALALICVGTMPLHIWMYSALPYHCLAIAYVAYAYSRISFAILRYNRDGAILFALGGSIVSLGLLYDIGALVFNFKFFDNVATLGFFCFLIVQALVLAIRFSHAFAQVETAERDIKRLNVDLQEHERVRTAMFHNTSHELRTPLNGILGFIRLIHSEHYGSIGEKPKAQLHKVESLARSLLNQVNNILDLAKSRQGSMTLSHSRFSLNELLTEVSNLSEALQTRQDNVKFTLHHSWLKETEAVFIGDQEKILTIIRNLLGNAFKFNKRQQENEVTIKFELLESEILRILVHDTGIGIAPEYFDKIFEEFRQVDDAARRSYEGTGLGLAICKSLVELMQGRIEVQSDLGVGSTFTVTIPAAKSTELFAPTPATRSPHKKIEFSKPVPLAHSQSEPQGQLDGSSTRPLHKIRDASPKILIIDDNPINCEVIKDILSAEGYRLETALSGEEGLLKVSSFSPDLILLDLMMPVISGEDVLHTLRGKSITAQIPVILITARASQEDRLHGLNLGADDYLAKPIMSEEMILRVKNSLVRLELTKKAAEKAAFEQDLSAVQMVNESISTSVADLPAFSIASYYQPAELTGGDWLGVFHDQERQRLFIMIGDVTGHGMKSALLAIIVAAAIKGSIEVLKNIKESESSEFCLKMLRDAANRLVFDISGRLDKSMTMAFLCIDLQTGDGCFLNAAHPPVCLIHKDKITLLLQRAEPLGYLKQKLEEPIAFHLAPGESLLMFTDGLTENTGPDGKNLSLRRLSKAIVGQEAGLAEHLKSLVIQQIEATVRQQKAEDDCCFCIISRKPLPALSSVS